MARYRIFSRAWWKDSACTIPGPTRKRYYPQTFQSEDEARRFCQSENAKRPGFYRHERDAHGNKVRKLIPNRGPRSMATEYEEA